MRRRVMSSNTCSARAFSTGTASRIWPSMSRAKPLTTWPAPSGNWSLPSSTRVFGLKNSICTRVSATPAATSTSIRSDCRRTGCSAPATTSAGGRQPPGGGATELRPRLGQRAGAWRRGRR